MSVSDIFYSQSTFNSIESGNLEDLIVSIRLDDINIASNYDGLTYLMFATQKADAKAIELLVSAGANLYAKNDLGDMAIHIAAKSGNILLVETLYEQGCDLNVMGQSATPISYALRFGWLQMAKYMVKCGADIDIADEFGITARQFALINGFTLE